MEANGAWRLEITDFPAVRAAMGEELLTAFCRCFIHADRLTALADFGSMSAQRHGESSAAHLRNLHTMFWLVAGTLHELALAVRKLGTQLEERQLIESLGDAWKSVQQIEQWADDPQRKKLRDKLGFHVDADPIRRGLRKLADAGGTVVVALGDGREVSRTYLPLGVEAAIGGLAMPASEVEPLVQSTAEHQLVPKALQEVFMTAMACCGVRRGEPRPL